MLSVEEDIPFLSERARARRKKIKLTFSFKLLTRVCFGDTSALAFCLVKKGFLMEGKMAVLVRFFSGLFGVDPV